MIQRIQSIYLLLAAVCGGLLFYLPIYEYNGITDISYTYVSSNPVMKVVNILVISFCIVNIFFFKNRLQQIRNCIIIIAITFLLIILVAVTIYIDKKTMPDGNFKLSCFLPVISLICTYLAFRHIRKDENLVKSTDRMR